MNLKNKLEEHSISSEELKSINEKLKSVSDNCSKPFTNLMEELNLSGFLYGSISRGDNVMPDADKIISQGGSPHDYFWGNDLDVVVFGLLDARELTDYFVSEGLDKKFRLHVYFYKKKDIKELSGFINKHVQGLPGDLKILPYGKKGSNQLKRIAKELGVEVKDVQIINDRDIRNNIKDKYDYNYPLGLIYDGVNKIGFSRHHSFLNGSNLRRAELGLIITQFISTVHANNCDEVIKEVKSSIDSIEVADIIASNTRTMYDKEANPLIESQLTDIPRYQYDGFLKLFRNVYIKNFGTKRCCKYMNALDFYEHLKGDLYEHELPVSDIRNALGIAAIIKILSRDPDNRELVLKTGNKMLKDCLSACCLIDKNLLRN